jgi:hypothetical protein
MNRFIHIAGRGVRGRTAVVAISAVVAVAGLVAGLSACSSAGGRQTAASAATIAGTGSPSPSAVSAETSAAPDQAAATTPPAKPRTTAASQPRTTSPKPRPSATSQAPAPLADDCAATVTDENAVWTGYDLAMTVQVDMAAQAHACPLTITITGLTSTGEATATKTYSSQVSGGTTFTAGFDFSDTSCVNSARGAATVGSNSVKLTNGIKAPFNMSSC